MLKALHEPRRFHRRARSARGGTARQLRTSGARRCLAAAALALMLGAGIGTACGEVRRVAVNARHRLTMT
jgi:hypothetical protein